MLLTFDVADSIKNDPEICVQTAKISVLLLVVTVKLMALNAVKHLCFHVLLASLLKTDQYAYMAPKYLETAFGSY